MTDPAVQILLLVVGALLSIVSTAALVMQSTNKQTLKEIVRDIRDLSDRLGSHLVAVARDYVTHDQLERHCRGKHRDGVHDEG